MIAMIVKEKYNTVFQEYIRLMDSICHGVV